MEFYLYNTLTMNGKISILIKRSHNFGNIGSLFLFVDIFPMFLGWGVYFRRFKGLSTYSNIKHRPKVIKIIIFELLVGFWIKIDPDIHHKRAC
jgi:hypothetical protein